MNFSACFAPRKRQKKNESGWLSRIEERDLTESELELRDEAHWQDVDPRYEMGEPGERMRDIADLASTHLGSFVVDFAFS